MKLVSPPTRQVRTWTTDSRRWSAYTPRPGDVVIATPAKTGTTWTQQIVTLLIHQTVENRPVMDMAPWIGMRVAPLDEMIAMLDAQAHRRAVKSHLPYDALPIYDEVRYIHVGRDGRDVMMSWHNHTTNYTPPALAAMDAAGLGDDTIARPLPRPPKDIHEFFRAWIGKGEGETLRDDFPATRFFDIEKSYWKHRHDENVLIVHYADLKADLGGEMRRIADFLGITVPEKLWPELIEAATFDSMKKNAASLLPRAQMGWQGGAERFLFSGTNARWRGALSDAEIAEYETRVREELPPGLARWLEAGRLATGEDPRTSPD